MRYKSKCYAPNRGHALKAGCNESHTQQEVLHLVRVKVCARQQLPVFKRRDHAFSDHLASINVEFKDFVLLKESVLHGQHGFKEI